MANLLRLLVTESTMKTHEFVVEDGLRFFLELAGGLGIPEPAAKKLYLQNWIVSAHRIEKFIGDDCFNSWLRESSGKSLDDLWAGFGFHAAAEHGAPVSFAVPAIIKQIAHEQGIEMANTMTTE